MEDKILSELCSYMNMRNNERPVRVRELLGYLSDEMSRKKINPPSKLFTETFDIVKYPSFVTKNKCYSEFGLHMEDVVLYNLSKLYGDKFEGGKRSWNENLAPSFLPEKDCEMWSVEMNKNVSSVVNYFAQNYPVHEIDRVIRGFEYKFNGIQGHPDLVIYKGNEVFIFDVKVFYKLSGKGKDSRYIRLQLSMYALLARENGEICNTVGVIMPWLRDPPVRAYAIEKWDSKPLVPLALESAECSRKGPLHCIKWIDIMKKYKIGSHIDKTTALELLKKTNEGSVNTNTPFQMFLYGNICSQHEENKGREKFARMNVNFSSMKAFIHAPYNLNFATDKEYVVTAAKNYMLDAKKFGFRGVVFHVGKSEDKENGVHNMKKNIQRILETATQECPFILETPCGQENELLSTPESFSEFVSQFPDDSCGVCLDTCHVFVSGYMPMEYIEKMGEPSDKICLVHFNGSRKNFGCKADGHSHITNIQKIPEDELMNVLEYAKKWNISCVTE